MGMPQTEILVTVEGVERGRYVLEPGEYAIGRNPDCAVRIEADLVSRRHALLTLHYDSVFIEDLGSSNGTSVNGNPVTGRTRLRSNQRIQVGRATIKLRRLKGEPQDMSLVSLEAVIENLLPAESLREEKYEIGRVVAAGGMGEILDVKEAALERHVAMKVMLKAPLVDDLMRFLNEAKITGQLEHPNIVPIHELGVDGYAQVFYTMKLVKGITLKAVLDRLSRGEAAAIAQYPLAVLLTVFQKVCDAIAFAHSKGVIHRDLKPDNIMLGDYGEVLAMDWGLAKVLDPAHAAGVPDPDAGMRTAVRVASPREGSGSVTLDGTVLGTPQFMSPEQARGEVESLDVRSDIYSLGAILYQILTLGPSVQGRTVNDVLMKVVKGEIIHPMTAAAELRKLPHLPGGRVPESLDAVVMKAMALSPSERYPSVPGLQGDIAAYQNGFATGAENASVVWQVVLLVKRHRALSTLAAVAAAVITVVTVIAFRQVGHERDDALIARNRATFEKKRAVSALGKAERSLLMIGDAHEDASRLISEMLANLKGGIGTATPEKALEGARQTVLRHLEESEPTEQDEESLHMRSVVLNRRGHFALSQGDFAGAEKTFADSLALRRSLVAERPGDPLWQHNLAISLDNLGDVHVEKAKALQERGVAPEAEYGKALISYRESLAIVKPLAALDDARPVWKHDLAVGYFKVGDTIYRIGNREAALVELRKGIEVAEKVANSDPEYAKWQATLGLYCLDMGRILGTFGKDSEARDMLNKGRAIFIRLRERKPLPSNYAEGLKQIDAMLKEISE